MNFAEKREFLNFKVEEFNRPEFIETDPIQIPHLFEKKEDIEIAGFLVATIAWGNRKTILKNGERMMEMLGNSPFDFVMNASEMERTQLGDFVHRTFNGKDFKFFTRGLQHLYKTHGGLEEVFTKYATEDSMQLAIHQFKKMFFEIDHLKRTEKHVSDPLKKSAAKRINMFLRWMVRNDQQGVDFGLWREISPAILSCPLDVHSGRVARKLKLLTRKQNDAKAVAELDKSLRQLDPQDPVKYDFALFGLGVFEKF